ncbi:DMT family transporter [Oscillibacter sp. MSJ-2]|uniref:DMT family transporter n=1 Tax=Dysosmobacter acutus TaxID=2841504 RepID=A0ABS6FBX2_9FIRM|nr:DMT family transporter [Dysosmobacter acutus]
MAAVIVVGTILSFSLFMQGIGDIGPVRSAMLATTEPVSATLFSFLFLRTRFSATDLMGFACIIAMILVLSKTNEEKTPAA